MTKDLIRRVRGVVGTMSVWAAAFAAVGVLGLIPLSLLGILPPFELRPFLRMLAATVVRWGLGGAGMGVAFAAAILLRERGRSVVALSPRRFAAWGFLAGAIVPIGIATLYELTGRSTVAINLRAGAVFAGICGVAGAALAVASLRAARRAAATREEDSRVRAPVI